MQLQDLSEKKRQHEEKKEKEQKGSCRIEFELADHFSLAQLLLAPSPACSLVSCPKSVATRSEASKLLDLAQCQLACSARV
jgi:hypothetical protein